MKKKKMNKYACGASGKKTENKSCKGNLKKCKY